MKNLTLLARGLGIKGKLTKKILPRRLEELNTFEDLNEKFIGEGYLPPLHAYATIVRDLGVEDRFYFRGKEEEIKVSGDVRRLLDLSLLASSEGVTLERGEYKVTCNARRTARKVTHLVSFKDRESGRS